MNNWWLGLSARERLLVIAIGAVLAIALLITQVWVPLTNKLASTKTSIEEQKALLEWMKPRADQLAALRAGGDTSAKTISASELLVVADRSAKSAGIADAVKRTNPEQGGGVRMVLEKARFDDVIQWLATLYRNQGVDISNLTVSGKDQAGYVDVRVSLQASSAEGRGQ